MMTGHNAYTLPMVIGHYIIDVAPGSLFVKRYKNTPIYKVVNQESGLIEGESFSLPRAMLQAKASTMSIDQLSSGNVLSEQHLISLETALDAMEGVDDEDNGRHH